MNNNEALMSLIPEPLKSHIDERAQEIIRRIYDEASYMLFATPEIRAQWMVDRLRSYLIFPDTFDTMQYQPF